MSIASYADLLREAAAQPQPQRLLFTFSQAGLPNDANHSEQRRFEERQGGTLTPVMCVDKPLHELSDFEALVTESQHTRTPWDIVFVSSMSEPVTQPAASKEVETALNKMVEAIKLGQVQMFLAFNRQGELLQFH